MHGKDDHRSCSRCRSRRRRPGGKATRAARGGVWAAIVLVLGATGGTVPGAAGATAGTAPSARAPAPATAIASIARAQTVRLGSQTLERCQEKPLAFCGKLAVPLDYSSPSGPFISVAYRWFPATAGPAKGTVVPVEGGPGYPSIGSVEYASGTGRAGYGPMYGPLLERWNMLAVDNRGTGASTPLRCTPLQGFRGATGTAAFQKLVGECGAALNRRWRYPDRSPVHASDMFTSAPAAEDLAAVLRSLGTGPVDLYGDSYGSFFAQVFAARYPSLVRSLVLDSTYPTAGLDPFYRSSVESMPGDFQAACSRAAACAAAEHTPVWARIGALAAALRAKPAAGTVPGPSGKAEKVSMNAVGLVDLVNDAAEDRQVYRELDAAARAFLEGGEAAPLLRLYAQRLAVDEAYLGLPTSEYSVELYFAVGCLDYPQLFALSASPAQRAAQLAAAQAALPAGTYAPFTTAEWLAQDENTEAYTGCLDWPAPTAADPPLPGPPPLLPSSLPVLVLGGELDAWTPPADVPKVLAEIGGHARFVELANSTHVVGEGETLCGSALIRAFVARPGELDTMDASCAPAVAAIHSVGAFPASLAAVAPLEPSPGASAPPGALRLAAAAVQTAGDAIARYAAIEATKDGGLHGGTVTATKGGAVLALRRDQLVPGVPVSGTVTLSPAAIPEDGQTAVATLSVPGAGGRAATFTATWTTSGSGAVARVAGEAGGSTVSGTMPAP
ncbi:MAG TPA: alpha/beta fold hydrolase [Solirubrobacteraceae bacterium]|nr:alpha/beta fold hydrolase [Solirubrobacteraceae bacterium]